MLLYTRKAVPKIPKKRSRAGCDYCRIKKKKCDESHPVCSRCKDAGEDCVYGPLRPRQRRNTAATMTEVAEDGGCFPSLSSIHATQQGYVTGPAALATATLAPAASARDAQATTPESQQSSWMTDDQPQAADSMTHSTAITRWSSHQPRARGFYATPRLELNMPLFSEYTSIRGRRLLLDHFSNVLSHLIVLREDDGHNPFQQLVLPMSRRSPAVASAIYALASAHLEFRGVAPDPEATENRSILFHTEAARNLAEMIERGAEGNQNELLAAVILLIYYEVLVHRERSQIINGHLKGAMAILKSVPAATTSDPTRVFLERAFRFYDVIAALSFGTSTLSEAPLPGCISPFLPVDSKGASAPVGSADALLGMATSLWPVVHQLSNLGGLKDQLAKTVAAGDAETADKLRSELDATASVVEASLLAWEPEMSLSADGQGEKEEVPGPLRGILSNALAYRHSSLVHLYRSIQGAGRDDVRVQAHVQASLGFCVGTVESDGPMGALLWPLFVAACEASDEGDRALAARSFREIEKHQGMANIEQSWRIVQEVWRRADAEEQTTADAEDVDMEIVLDATATPTRGNVGQEDLWRQVCRDMGLAVVFG